MRKGKVNDDYVSSPLSAMPPSTGTFAPVEEVRVTHVLH
jgi:hypothetical protein